MKISVNQDEITLESPEEALFWSLCRFHGITVQRARLDGDSVFNGDVLYCPGFRVFVPKILDLWVEAADGDGEAMLRPLRTAWRAEYGTRRLVVLYREELDRLRDAGRPAQFVARLRQAQGQH